MIIVGIFHRVAFQTGPKWVIHTHANVVAVCKVGAAEGPPQRISGKHVLWAVSVCILLAVELCSLCICIRLCVLDMYHLCSPYARAWYVVKSGDSPTDMLIIMVSSLQIFTHTRSQGQLETKAVLEYLAQFGTLPQRIYLEYLLWDRHNTVRIFTDFMHRPQPPQLSRSLLLLSCFPLPCRIHTTMTNFWVSMWTLSNLSPALVNIYIYLCVFVCMFACVFVCMHWHSSNLITIVIGPSWICVCVCAFVWRFLYLCLSPGFGFCYSYPFKIICPLQSIPKLDFSRKFHKKFENSCNIRKASRTIMRSTRCNHCLFLRSISFYLTK